LPLQTGIGPRAERVAPLRADSSASLGMTKKQTRGGLESRLYLM
jgi:hypothetical protein